jgi:hypothetical protein
LSASTEKAADRITESCPPHFHAEYAEHEALVAIETLEVVRGELPRRALALVLEWAACSP